MMQWKMQPSIIKMNQKVRIDFTLPEISVTQMMTRNYHMNAYNKIRYDMILGRDILSSLGTGLKNIDHAIEGGDGLSESCTALMVDLGTYEFKIQIYIQCIRI